MQWGIVYTTWSIIVCYDIIVRGEYIGCYEETSDLYESHDIRAMDLCRNDCSEIQKTYYVVKKRGDSDNIECHCADRLPGESTDEFGCNRECGGECGGPRSHSIYSVCDRGYWGWSCGSRCYCEDDDVCQKRTGLCPGGCQSGYWGQSCNSLCHCTVQCQQIGGICDAPCTVGYWGGTCSSTCHCFNSEHCKKDNGNCLNGCATGWSDVSCDVCASGYYGALCGNRCHCKENAVCDRITGHCPQGCATGWSCGSCDVCASGYYGALCDQRCHCKEAARCGRDKGLCPDGCDPGKYGPSCDKEVPYENIGCFSSEILQDSIPENIQDNRDRKEDCRQMCISGKSAYFTVVADTDIDDKCHCIKNSPYSHRQECPSSNLLRKLLAIDTFIIIYTVCPVGSYSTNGIDCNQYCSCPGDSNQSGLCVYDSDSGTEVCEECTGGWQGELCAQDVNECHSDDHSCEGDCVNVPGSYHCTCPDGMQLAADYRACVNIITGPSDSHKGLSNTTIAIIAVVFGVLVILAVTVTTVVLVRRRKSKTSYPGDHKTAAPKPSALNIYNNIYDAEGEEKVEGIYHTIPDSESKRPTSEVVLIENTNYESQEMRPASDDKRPTSDVIISDNTNYESQETHADPDDKQPTSDVIILDNTNYESQDLANNAQQRENVYCLAKETRENYHIKNVSADSQTVVVNGDVYNLPNKPQKIDLKENGKLLAEDSKIKDIDKSVYSLATEGVGAGNGKGAYSPAKNPEDPGISGGAYSLAKNPEDTGINGAAYSLERNPKDPDVSGGVYNLTKNPDNGDVNDVKEDTNVRTNESEKIVNGDIYRLPSK